MYFCFFSLSRILLYFFLRLKNGQQGFLFVLETKNRGTLTQRRRLTRLEKFSRTALRRYAFRRRIKTEKFFKRFNNNNFKAVFFFSFLRTLTYFFKKVILDFCLDRERKKLRGIIPFLLRSQIDFCAYGNLEKTDGKKRRLKAYLKTAGEEKNFILRRYSRKTLVFVFERSLYIHHCFSHFGMYFKGTQRCLDFKKNFLFFHQTPLYFLKLYFNFLLLDCGFLKKEVDFLKLFFENLTFFFWPLNVEKSRRE